jgi:hypothetical protein
MVKELSPNEIVRWYEGPKYFGLKLTQLREKVEAGEIPPPMVLSDTGRAKGWFGSQIIEHHERLAKRAAAQCGGVKKRQAG